MQMTKRSFVDGIQSHDGPLSPYEVSQRVRLAIGCVSICSLDAELPVAHLRGYMVRLSPKVDRTAEDPELYDCVVSTQQSPAWQAIIWTKEILGIFDSDGERTNTKAALGAMIDNRKTPHLSTDHPAPNVRADINGLVLALGVAVPQRYRLVLRKEKFLERYVLADVEKLLMVPAEKITYLLSDDFEADFETALSACM